MSPKSQLSMAAFGLALVIVLIQIYLFETALASVLDGHRNLLAGALVVSALMSGVALWIAYKLPTIDRKP